MEMKYEGYYDKEMIYKATFEDLEKSEDFSDEMILAFIRNYGPENLVFIVPAYQPENITAVPILGFAMCSGDKVHTFCEMILEKNGLYNPLIEDNSGIHEKHWYSPYKIKFKPIEFEGCTELYYFSDFCSMLRDGYVEIHLKENIMEI